MKIISESKVSELLKKKAISIEDYHRSSLPALKEKEPIDQCLETISKCTDKIEKMVESINKENSSKFMNLGLLLKEYADKLLRVFNKPSGKPVVKWHFIINRDSEGRIESIEAEPEKL